MIRHECLKEVKDTLCGVVYCKEEGGVLSKISVHTYLFLILSCRPDYVYVYVRKGFDGALTNLRSLEKAFQASMHEICRPLSTNARISAAGQLDTETGAPHTYSSSTARINNP